LLPCLVRTLCDECLRETGDITDFAAAPEPAQVDEVGSDRPENPAAARDVEPPGPGGVECLRPPIAPEVRLQRQLDVAQLAQRVRANQLSGAAAVRFEPQFVVEPRDAVGMLF